MVKKIKKAIDDVKEKITIRKLLHKIPLSSGLDLSKMRITKIRAIKREALFDIFEDIYKSFQGQVWPRLQNKAIMLNASFSYIDETPAGISCSAPLACIVDPIHLETDRSRNLRCPHYIRFNTEFCINVPPTRNYTGLDKVIENYVVSVDSDFVEGKDSSSLKEWVIKTGAKKVKA